MITIPDNQVIKAVSAFDCTCRDKYKSPFELADTTPIYVQLSELGSNYIANGTFGSSTGWTLGANWAVGSGVATYTSGATNSISRDTDIPLVAGYYLIKLDFTSLTSGGLFMTVSLGGSSTVLGGALGSGWDSQTFYIFDYLTPANNTLSIQGQVYSFSIDNVEVYRLSEVGFDIKDCDTDVIIHSETNNASVSYFETGNTVDGEDLPTVTTGYATVTFDWDGYGLDEGCYYVCFNDPALSDAEYIRNGGFADDDFWSISNTGVNGWAIGAGVAAHTVGGAAGDDTLTQEVNLDGDLCYTLFFDVASVSGLGDKVISVYATVGGVDVLLSTETISSFPAGVEISIANQAATAIKFVCNAAGLRNASIDNVTITDNGQCEVCQETHCISLTTDWDTYAEDRKMCNIKVTGYNESAWGFPDRYSFIGRIFGKIRNSRYPDEESVIYRDLSGAVSLQYNENTEIKELQVFEVPERVHDWLRLALRSQTLTLEINGVSKTFVKVAGDYTPNWRKTSTYAPVIVEIMETNQVSSNARNV